MGPFADISRIFVEVALADARGKGLTDKKQDQIKRILFVLSVAAGRLSDRYMHDIAHPGYVRCEAGEYSLFIPFHLAEFFPEGELLDALLELVRIVALEDGNPICISGSITFEKGVSCFSDLDMCEYYLSDSFIESAASAARKVSAAAANLSIAELRYLRESYGYPDRIDQKQLEADFVSQIVNEPQPTIRLDMILWSDQLGLLPASSLVLLVDPGAREAGAAARSFAFQEAVLTRDSQPPRTLVGSASLGGYLNFLRAEAEKYATGNPVKSLKRALCFFMLTRSSPLMETVLDVLRRQSVRFLVDADRQSTLDGLLAAAPPATAARLEAMRPARIPADQVAYAEALTHPVLSRIAHDMFMRIDELYDGLGDEDG